MRRLLQIEYLRRRYAAIRASDLAGNQSALSPADAWRVLERAILYPTNLSQLFALGNAITGGIGTSGILNRKAIQVAFETGAWVLVPEVQSSAAAEAQIQPVADQVKLAKLLKTWVEMEVLDEQGQPMRGEKFTCMLPDGTIHLGNLDDKGCVRFDGIDPGNCAFSLTSIHSTLWRRS